MPASAAALLEWRIYYYILRITLTISITRHIFLHDNVNTIGRMLEPGFCRHETSISASPER